MFRKIWNWVFRKTKKQEDESSLLYYDENGFAFTITLICSCQNPLKIVKYDENYEPTIPHFKCDHCDYGCAEKKCPACIVYSKMTDARIAIEE